MNKIAPIDGRYATIAENIDWLLNAEHGSVQERCRSIANQLRGCEEARKKAEELLGCSVDSLKPCEPFGGSDFCYYCGVDMCSAKKACPDRNGQKATYVIKKVADEVERIWWRGMHYDLPLNKTTEHDNEILSEDLDRAIQRAEAAERRIVELERQLKEHSK